MRITRCQKFQNERFSGLDFNCDLFARGQAVIKRGRGKDADIRISLAEFVVLCEHVGIEEVAQKVVLAHRVTQFFVERRGRFGEVNGFEARARTAFERGSSAQNYFLQLARPAAGRNAKHARKHFYDGIRERKVVLLVEL